MTLMVAKPGVTATTPAPQSLPQLKQVDAGLLNVGYIESGPAHEIFRAPRHEYTRALFTAARGGLAS